MRIEKTIVIVVCGEENRTKIRCCPNPSLATKKADTSTGQVKEKKNKE